MRSYIFVSAFAAAVLAQDSSSTDAFPQTTFLAQTNSNGVVTGQPAAATSQPSQPAADVSQPAADTSIPALITIPAVGTTGMQTITQGIAGTNQTHTFTVSASNSTTAVIGALPSGVTTGRPSGSGSGASGSGGARPTGADASGSGADQSGSPSESGNAAAPTMKAVAGSLIGAGAFVAAFL